MILGLAEMWTLSFRSVSNFTALRNSQWDSERKSNSFAITCSRIPEYSFTLNTSYYRCRRVRVKCTHTNNAKLGKSNPPNTQKPCLVIMHKIQITPVLEVQFTLEDRSSAHVSPNNPSSTFLCFFASIYKRAVTRSNDRQLFHLFLGEHRFCGSCVDLERSWSVHISTST